MLQILRVDGRELKTRGYYVRTYPQKIRCGTGSLAAVAKNLPLTAGQVTCVYDEVDTFIRVHGILPAGSDSMSLTLSAYDGQDIKRNFMGKQWNSHCPNPHFNIIVCSQPDIYKDRLMPLRDCGGLPRIVHNWSEKKTNLIDRIHFKGLKQEVLDHLISDILINAVLEDISEIGLYCSQTGNTAVVQYSTVVDTILAQFDHIV